MKCFYIFHAFIQVFVQQNFIKQGIVVINKDKDIIIFIATTQGQSLENTQCLFTLSELSTLEEKTKGIEKWYLTGIHLVSLL